MLRKGDDRAPAHELYVRLSNGTTLTIFNHPHEGFEYLGAPSTLATSFNVSNYKCRLPIDTKELSLGGHYLRKGGTAYFD